MSPLELPSNMEDSNGFNLTAIENLSISLSEANSETQALEPDHNLEPNLGLHDPVVVQKALGAKSELKMTHGRQYFYERASDEIGSLLDSMLSVADQNDIQIPQEAIDNWQPDDNETKLLNKNLSAERKQLQIMDGLGAYNQGVEELRQGTQLRKHQNKTLEAVDEFLESTPADEHGSKITLVQLPTAAGKSGIIAKVAEAAKFDESSDDPVKVLVLEPTQQLVDQIVGEGKDTGFSKFAPDLEVGRYFQDAKDTNTDVISMCNSSFNILAAKGELPEADIIIADEAHMLGPTTQTNLEEYRKGKATLGLTATPSKAKEMFGEPIIEMDLCEGIQDYGILAPVRRAELLEATPIIDYESLPEDPYARQAEIQEAKFKARLEVAVPKIVDAVERGLSVVVRCPAGDDIDYARRTAETLREATFNSSEGTRNVRAIEVGGSKQRTALGKKLQNLALDEFNQGRVDVLTHVKKIGVGSDLPRAKFYVDLDSTSNSDTVIQNFGRVLRQFTDPETGKQVPAESLEFIDPDLGDKQCTVLKVLRLEHDEPLAYEPLKVEKPIKSPEIRIRESSVVLKGVESRLLDVESVEAKPKPAFPDGLDVKQAADWFGVSSITLKGILKNLGGDDIARLSADDMELITIYNPKLAVADFPENNNDYTSVQDAMEVLNFQNVKPEMFMRILQYKGLMPTRFRTANGVEKFFSRADLQNFINDQTTD
jgi:superfamily II DNA or RNA helicase